MDFATGPLSSLLPKLAKLLQDEYKLHKGARKGIEFLHKELETMHAVLRKVGEVPREQLDELQRIWARDVRELSYDMEDIVDTFMLDVEGPDPPSKRGARKVFNKMIRKVNKAMARREVAQDINDIKERAKELAERRDRYKVDGSAPTKTCVDPRLKAQYTKATEIVGIEEAKEQVIKMLAEGHCGQEKGIVSIAGFGGLGKTTIANAVYGEIKKDFGCTAFVSVSRNPDPKKLLKDMLYSFDKEKFKDEIHSTMLDVKQLIDLGHKHRYLIVIDDIWAKEPWDEVIKPALIENNMSRIITTTRNADVARHIGGYYRLKPLSVESSEMLFYGRIFGWEVKCPSHISQVSKRILKKCGGVPLAITTISSLLANKPHTIKEWDKVCESIGSGLLGSDPGAGSMKKILLLSYDILPSHLKTCLLYLSIFPEDYDIRKDRLIWRWVAEGFIQEKKGDQSLYGIGESYFNELINRSMIQAADTDEEGTPRACRVHDMVLDLIVSLSGEECFITTVSGDGNHSLGSKQAIRRLSLQNYTSWPIMKNMKKLRSISIFGPDGTVICSMPSLSCYDLLRVLDLRGCKLKDIASMRFIGSLSHLRYLGLSSSKDWSRDARDQLPVEIGKLRFLQALDVSQTNVKELPSSIVRLSQLMWLRGCQWATILRGRWWSVLPVGLKNLTSLEVLEQVEVTSGCIAEELGHLTQLRVLNVRVPSPDDIVNKAMQESLGKLKKIEDLYLDGNYDYTFDDFYGSMQGPLGNLGRLGIEDATYLPTWIKPSLLPGLSNLHIDVLRERKDDIHVLGTLPCLRCLQFVIRSAPEQGALDRCVVGDDAFPCAVSCEFAFADGPNLLPCMFPPGAMPRLQHLKLYIRIEEFGRDGGCSIDDLALGHLPSLRSVVLRIGGDDDEDSDEVREKLEHEAAVHPNHPTIRFW
ncbi:hypothetical protein HU200_066634 [Digitaria exilis]|uniref:Uncharacterized protein n=1 Tax=Digitaria exilis TaxID=1010633 RepID=A0A835DWY2_9POAL|nr:hypothetical protein HU200_066634 [Digitaria exilis]